MTALTAQVIALHAAASRHSRIGCVTPRHPDSVDLTGTVRNTQQQGRLISESPLQNICLANGAGTSRGAWSAGC